ncbi:MAG: aminomethyl-transferring glycine dehydrogenase subunit GcvPA [Candidatus Gastranaerophilales bacterium]|nr:aminomethyl-transferring glycine dehydrogenase subunit GcvPA [Candidatus Gastranaerophilales bacterium]
MNNYKANSTDTIKEMLESIGESSIDGLFSMIDEKARMKELSLPDALSEMQVQKEIKSISKENKTDYSYFIGAGSYKRFIPAAISQIASRFEFNTAYTPYQPEISQGTLQVIYEFQSMICDITGMEVCNASVYDAGNACAEAVLMAARISGKNKILVSGCLNPQYSEVIKTYANAGNIIIEEVKTQDFKTDINSAAEKLMSGDYAGLIIQNPNFYGTIEDIEVIKSLQKAPKTMLIVCAEMMSNTVLKKPAYYNADIVVGDVQSFGNSISFGGPYAGFIAALDKYKRQLPGRIVGRTLDTEGRQAFTLTLQAREQHIRREKATSNICSNQGLAILNAVLYLSLSGRQGVEQAAYLSAKNSYLLQEGLKSKGYKILNKNVFNEFVLETDNADDFLSKMKKQNILAGYKLNNTQILVCTTENNTKEEIENYIKTA